MILFKKNFFIEVYLGWAVFLYRLGYANIESKE